MFRDGMTDILIVMAGYSSLQAQSKTRRQPYDRLQLKGAGIAGQSVKHVPNEREVFENNQINLPQYCDGLIRSSWIENKQ